MKTMFSRRVSAVLAVSAAIFGLVPAGTASAAKQCDFSFSTGKFGCTGSNGVRKSTDVIGARIYTGTGYTGDMLTIWVPQPCPKNDKVDHFMLLNDSSWRNRVNSAQAFSTCWVWLYRKDGNRDGPFQGNHPDLTFAGDRTFQIGLS
ncbi:hypothetical protein PV646_33630 [Streptomyces sp. ID05-26A]|nr:hypothetical protein [Streptomyces sp. ID05-26A]